MSYDYKALEAAASVLAERHADELTSYLARGRVHRNCSEVRLAQLYKIEHTKWCVDLSVNATREFADLHAEYSLRGSEYASDSEDDRIFAVAATRLLEFNPKMDQEAAATQVFKAYEAMSRKRH